MIDNDNQNNLNKPVIGNNTNRNKIRLCKNGCGVQIYLNKVSSSPVKWLPYDSKTGTFHQCIKRPSKYSCKYCNDAITFNENRRSSTGKVIPLNLQDLSPHNCPNNPFNLSKVQELQTMQE
jgi:hypothetical protein